ncbi:hypothetical protein EV177_000828 [Coemansia sp. RSA 1804]|nr:hypothetical protein EV177_000828 [Coemansia sp. RSA 1804]
MPVMVRETAWYPLAYPEPEMRRCPRDHTGEAPEETREHLLACTIGDPEPPRPHPPGSVAGAWMDGYIAKTTPMVGLTQRDRKEATEALRMEMQPHQRTARDPTKTTVRKFLQMSYRRRLEYIRERWVARNEKQIEKERSRIKPGRRRRLIKEEQPQGNSMDDGVPKWPRTRLSEAELRKCALAVLRVWTGQQAS